MKKLFTLALAGLMSVSLAACGGSTPADSDTQSEAEPTASSAPAAVESDDTAMKIAMITDYGDITDQSFNQTTYEACKKFAEDNGLEFTYKKPQTDADADRESSIDEAVEEGYNVIVMPGYAFAKAVVDEAPMYPDVKFVALDVSQYDLDSNSGESNWSQDNVYSAVYKEELPGYMAGYAAVKLGYKKLGFLGGMAVPSVVRYGYGFVQGAETAATELGLTDVTINYTYAGQFFGDADITARMDTWYQGGTEVVFACGGGVFTSACEAAVKTDGKVIGVDVDQAGTIDGAYGEGLTVTSAMKGLTATVNTLLGAIKDGKWDEYKGQVQELGIVSDDPDLNYVGLPASTQWSDGFTEDDYKAMVAAMNSGEITVDNSTEAMPATEAVTVNDEGNIKG